MTEYGSTRVLYHSEVKNEKIQMYSNETDRYDNRDG